MTLSLVTRKACFSMGACHSKTRSSEYHNSSPATSRLKIGGKHKKTMPCTGCKRKSSRSQCFVHCPIDPNGNQHPGNSGTPTESRKPEGLDSCSRSATASSGSSVNLKCVSFNLMQSEPGIYAPLAKSESMTICGSNVQTPDDEYKSLLSDSKQSKLSNLNFEHSRKMSTQPECCIKRSDNKNSASILKLATVEDGSAQNVVEKEHSESKQQCESSNKRPNELHFAQAVSVSEDHQTLQPSNLSERSSNSVEDNQVYTSSLTKENVGHQYALPHTIPETEEPDQDIGLEEDEADTVDEAFIYGTGTVVQSHVDTLTSYRMRVMSESGQTKHSLLDRKCSLPAYSPAHRFSKRSLRCSTRGTASSPGPAGPHSAGPHSAGPHSAGPHSAGPHSAEELLVIDVHVYQQLRAEATQLKAALLRMRRLLQQTDVTADFVESLARETRAVTSRSDLLKENYALRERVALLETQNQALSLC